MILLDTNVLIYAFDLDSPFCKWARETIIGAVTGDGAAINAVSLAEICVVDSDPPAVADRIRSWGVEILDVPVAAADVCATAYRRYRK
jgi:predicted nucleic acid-binding protein